jgi:hypothetical protein
MARNGETASAACFRFRTGDASPRLPIIGGTASKLQKSHDILAHNL